MSSVGRRRLYCSVHHRRGRGIVCPQHELRLPPQVALLLQLLPQPNGTGDETECRDKTRLRIRVEYSVGELCQVPGDKYETQDRDELANGSRVAIELQRTLHRFLLRENRYF